MNSHLFNLLIHKLFKGMWLVFIITAELAKAEAKITEPNEIWMRQFNNQIHAVYLLMHPSSFDKNLTSNDLYVETKPQNLKYSELISYKNGASLGRGCIVSVESSNIENLGESCDKSTMNQLTRQKLKLPNCPTTRNTKNNQTVPQKYFINIPKNVASCIYGYETFPNFKNVDESSLIAKTPVLAGLPPKSEIIGYQSGPVTNLFFPSAPYWTADEGYKNALACNPYPISIFAFEVAQAIPLDSIKYPLTSPYLLWGSMYISRIKKAYACSDGYYNIDLIIRPVNLSFADDTMLILGNRTALRIRVRDGSTEAPTTIVVKLIPGDFVETLTKDGGENCLRNDLLKLCKWLSQEVQDNTKTLKSPKSTSPDVNYTKSWYQGFDHAIQRIYFK